ncbi:uncharacterized protein LOC131619151 [Vicia villosa]|uniref:uncharacterized protein LOC131619151 n=1 Tax=Vicia villosa TaxID=3911 RepID=UPI00273C0FEA|nr:uncharacterized protein LOC131619151 [Vicia villosa]
MLKMQRDSNFNHHAKCDKLYLTNLNFVDDVLLFYRGDAKSVEIMMDAFRRFSESMGLISNPSKCIMYFGDVDNGMKEILRGVTEFEEGSLPVKYLGVPLTSKKLTIHHYKPLVKKICFPIHKYEIKKIDAIRRTFIWTGKHEPSIKTFVAWKREI